MRHTSLRLAFALSALSLLGLSAFALAGEMRLTKLGVKDGASGATVTVSGKLSAPGDVALPATVEFQCGTTTQALAAEDVLQTTKAITYKAPKGTTTGILKFSLSLKTGKFSLAAKGVDVASLDDPLPFTLDVGGERFTGLFPLKGKGSNRSWKKGQPIQATLTGRILRVSNALGNPILTPVPGAAFVRDDAEEEEVSVVAGDPTTDADGVFSLTIEFRDPAVLGRLDIGSVLGRESTLTRPGNAPVTPGEGGTYEAVAFVQTLSGVGGTVSPSAPSTFEVTGTGGAPSGTLDIPEGAVTADAPGVSFTPYAMAVELPAPLPEGYIALAGAEVKAIAPTTFVAAKSPTLEVSRPSWTEKTPLATADIRLLQYRNGQWEEQSGRGMYDPLKDRFVPDFITPARLKETKPTVYAAKVALSQSQALRGKVVDPDGNAIPGATVLSRAGGTVSGQRGSFKVPKSTVTSSALEVVQVVGAGTSTGRVVTAADAAAGEVTVEVAEEAPPVYLVGVVLGTVYESGGTKPAAGAKVTLSIAGSVRGLLHDTADTADNFADDQFAVPDLTSLGVTAYEWALAIPGDGVEFVSTLYTTNTVNPTLLMLEAQGAGRTIPDGAYTVRVGYAIPNLGPFNLFGGFRVTTEGIDLVVSDVQVPAGFEGTPSVQVTANSQGQYVKFYRAPTGIPMTATATSATGTNTVTRSFYFAAFVTIDLNVDAPTPEGIPIGWSVRASMPEPRDSIGVVALSGRIYVVGGGNTVNWPTTVVVYDPSTDSWETKASMRRDRLGPAAATAGGLVYAFGGGSSWGVEAYDPATDTWSVRAAMSYDRYLPSAGVVNGKILVCGGQSNPNSGPVLDDLEEYDPISNTWTARRSLPLPRWRATAAVVDGILYLVGGSNSIYGGPGIATSDVWAYSSATDSWTTRAPMPVRRNTPACGVIDGEVYVVGGDDNTEEFSTMYIYKPSTDTWRRGPDMPTARVAHGAVVVGGVLYVVGGAASGQGPVVDTVWAYRPK